MPDWPQVVAEADEFLEFLQPWAISDAFLFDPMANVILVKSTPRSKELAIRLEVYGRQGLPDLAWQLETNTRRGRNHAREVVGKLSRLAKLRAAEQELSGAPLPLDQLHPLVWTDEVQDLWRVGKHRLALEAAAQSVEAELRRRDHSEGSGREINGVWFGDKSDVTFAGYRKGSKNSKSAQQGVRGLGEAVFALVRNLSVHSHAELAWVDAFELLAVLSAYARHLGTASDPS
jgi:hypothetical protein